MRTQWKALIVLLLSTGVSSAAYVTIGSAGNADDATGYGGVGYTYKISDHEVTIAEFQASGAGGGNETYWNDGTRTVGTGAPASFVTLYEAMRYCNWLTSGNIDHGAYVFSGGVYQSTARASAISTYGTLYALPTQDEWYKAAYYTGSGYSDYANGDDVADGAPTHGTTSGWNYYNDENVNDSPNYTWVSGYGGEEQNGTYDMMGNVWEWMEDSTGVVRGGSYYDYEILLRSSGYIDGYDPSFEFYGVGFRPVEVVPEPATTGLFAISGLLIAGYRRFFGRL